MPYIALRPRDPSKRCECGPENRFGYLGCSLCDTSIAQLWANDVNRAWDRIVERGETPSFDLADNEAAWEEEDNRRADDGD